MLYCYISKTTGPIALPFSASAHSSTPFCSVHSSTPFCTQIRRGFTHFGTCKTVMNNQQPKIFQQQPLSAAVFKSVAVEHSISAFVAMCFSLGRSASISGIITTILVMPSAIWICKQPISAMFKEIRQSYQGLSHNREEGAKANLINYSMQRP